MKPPAINMKKYLSIIKNESQKQMTYRVNIAAYTLGNIFEIIVQVVIWTVIFSKTAVVNGYSYNEMMTYVIIGWFILFATTNYNFEGNIARDVQQGTLSNYLVKPISYLRYMAAVSLGRISFALFVVIITQIVLLFVLQEHLILNTDPLLLLMIFIMMVLAYLIKFFIAVLIGALSFWFTEISGIFFSLGVIAKFLSGAYFPLALLPVMFVKVSLWFPFAYTFFVPIQLYLGKLTLLDGVKAIGVQAVWLFVLYAIIKFVWHLGLRRYESAGS